MSDNMNIDAYITSPFSSDIKKQRDAAFESAKNIRKVTETPEEYRLRLAQEEIERQERLRNENTGILQERLANIDIRNIATKNRAAIEDMIRQAESIKYFALYNNYDMNAIDFRNLDKAIKVAQMRLKSLRSGKDEDLGTGIYTDNYKPASKDTSILDKLAGGSSAVNTNYGANIRPTFRK